MRPVCALVAIAFLAAAASPAAARTRYIFTVAGTGVAGFSGDGGDARAAAMDHPRGVAFLRDGGFLVAEANNNVVRHVSAERRIRTVAGDGSAAFGGDGGPATAAQLDFVHDVDALPRGRGFLVADLRNRRIRRVSRSGRITTVVGRGYPGTDGDGGPARRAEITLPHGIAVAPNGDYFIADTDNDEIRKVTRRGRISRFAGSTGAGYSGDGGPARRAKLSSPFDVAVTPGGGVLVADTGNDVIRKVTRAGRIVTVAGTGAAGYGGDGGKATRARLAAPHGVAALPDGSFLIADTGNDRVRLVTREGRITTVAGDGTRGFGGDGGRSTRAQLDRPKGVAHTRDGGFLVADSGNNRVRFVATAGRRPLSVDVAGRRGGRRAVRVRYRWSPLTALAGGRTVLRFRSTVRSRVVAGFSQDGTEIVRVRGRARPGRNALALPPELGPGTYRVTLDARTVDGQRYDVGARVRVVAPELPSAPAGAGGDGLAGVGVLLIALGGGLLLLLGLFAVRRAGT